MDIRELIKKWEGVLKEGNEITSDRVLKSTAVMLENQHNFLMETNAYFSGGASQASLGTGDINGGTYPTSGMFHKIAVPMVRRTFPELVAHQLVGVQPLTGPVGLAFALRYRAGSTVTGGSQTNAGVAGSPSTPSYEDTYTANSTELGYNNINQLFSGTYVTSAGEALGSLGTTPGTVGSDIGLGIGAGAHIREVNLTVEKTQVEARTRKLRSRWSMEVAQDLKAMHGLDLEEEMMDILAYEITQEIDRELLLAIDSTVRTAGASYATTWDFLASAQGVKGRWEMERYRELYHTMLRRSQDIAINTRRGSGNWVVGNPRSVAILETLAAFAIAPVPGDVNIQPTGVSRIGSLDGRLVVYRDTFETRDQMIIGYKGPSEYDTGVIYLPYIQLLASRAVFENSFHPTVGLMSRYAIHNHLFGAQNYYQLMTLTSLPS
jgi:hypothetical protein